jgi:predicted Zn-dependent protease with MMP-like domain
MPAAPEDQIDRHLDNGYKALEREDLGAARKSANAALALDQGVAEAHSLLGAVAEREGDVDAARRAYQAARKVDPEAFEPILALAEIEHAQGDVAKARKLYSEAVDRAEEEEEFIEALLAHAEFELAEGDAAAAYAALEDLPPVELPEPNDHLRAGDILRQVGAAGGSDAKVALETAAGHFEAARTQAGDDPTLLADAIYGLGLVAEARGDNAKMTESFIEVLALDTKEPRPDWSLSDERMEALVEDTLGELPERAQQLLANVPIILEARPSRAQVQEGLDPRLLGLFSGPSHPDRGDAPALQQITLYQRNLERASASIEDLEEEVRITLLHETGHFFGLDEDALTGFGLD